MIRTLVFAPEADWQIQTLEDYLATRFSEDGAARYIDNITSSCEGLLESSLPWD